MVRERTSLMLRLMISPKVLLPAAVHDFPDSVKDHHRIGQGIAGQG